MPFPKKHGLFTVPRAILVIGIVVCVGLAVYLYSGQHQTPEVKRSYVMPERTGDTKANTGRLAIPTPSVRRGSPKSDRFVDDVHVTHAETTAAIDTDQPTGDLKPTEDAASVTNTSRQGAADNEIDQLKAKLEAMRAS